MENLLRKYGWAVRLGVIALICLLIALAINGFIAGLLAPYTVPEVPDLVALNQSQSAPTKSNTNAPQADWTKAIDSRCFFGCVEAAPAPTCPPEGCPEGQQCVAGQCVDEQASEPLPGLSDLPVPSDLNLKLIGVMVSSRPEWSTAVLEDQGTKQTYVVRTEEMVAAQATLVDVRRDRIILERNGRLEYIRLVDSLMGNPSASAARSPMSAPVALPPNAPPAVVSPPPTQVSGPASSGVQRTDANTFQIDRNVMNAQLSNKAALAQGATIVPNYKSGKKSGLKLVNVNGGSVYQQLGLQSGDVLQSVNGQEIRSQAHAMELMERFRQADNVSIEIERQGQSQKLDYNIK